MTITLEHWWGGPCVEWNPSLDTSSATPGEVARARLSNTSKKTFNLTSKLVTFFGERISQKLTKKKTGRKNKTDNCATWDPQGQKYLRVGHKYSTEQKSKSLPPQAVVYDWGPLWSRPENDQVMALPRKAVKKEACGQGSCKEAIVPCQPVTGVAEDMVLFPTLHMRRETWSRSSRTKRGVVSSISSGKWRAMYPASEDQRCTLSVSNEPIVPIMELWLTSKKCLKTSQPGMLS